MYLPVVLPTFLHTFEILFGRVHLLGVQVDAEFVYRFKITIFTFESCAITICDQFLHWVLLLDVLVPDAPACKC